MIPQFTESGSHFGCHCVGVPGEGKDKVIGEKGIKLGSQHSAFGQQRAPLLYIVFKVGLKYGVADHHGLSQESPALGSADIEHIAEAAELGQGDISGHQGHGQPRTVNKH
ncbi:hypothetical protein FQZ97_812870 [compost metagenome]